MLHHIPGKLQIFIHVGIYSNGALHDERAGAAQARAAQRDRLHPDGIKAQRLRRVNGRDIERCAACGGTLRVIACIEDRALIETILVHRRRASLSASGAAEARGPPPTSPPG